MNRQSPTMNNLDILDTQQRIDKLTVTKLKDIARSIGLALSGRKLDIQERIKLFFNNGIRSNDFIRLLTVRTLVLKASNDQLVPNYQMLYVSLQSNSHQIDAPNQYSNITDTGISPLLLSKGHESARPWLYFKESPFYRLKRLVHGTPVLAHKAPETRGNCSVSFVLNENETSLLNGGPQYHLLLLSGVYNGTSSQEALIQFPQPLEIHFNGNLVKDNVKGIKNKPGTARPADLTKYLRFAPTPNKLDLVYAFAKTDFLIFCYIVEMITPEMVLAKITSQPHILKLATLKEIQREQDEEDDLLEMQEVISLRCPLTYGRMKYPAKSLYCKHIQCFDGLSFLQLQEQASTWSCPICQKSVSVKTLAIDDYLDEVIKLTGENDEAIEIEHNGVWKVKNEDDINGINQGETAVNEPFKNDNSASFAKREELTPSIPTEASANPVDAIEIISLDSDSDSEPNDEGSGSGANHIANEQEQDMEDLFHEIEREVEKELSPINLVVIEPPVRRAGSHPILNTASNSEGGVAQNITRESIPLPPPLDPPPRDAISATLSMIDSLAINGIDNGQRYQINGARDKEVVHNTVATEQSSVNDTLPLTQSTVVSNGSQRATTSQNGNTSSGNESLHHKEIPFENREDSHQLSQQLSAQAQASVVVPPLKPLPQNIANGSGRVIESGRGSEGINRRSSEPLSQIQINRNANSLVPTLFPTDVSSDSRPPMPSFSSQIPSWSQQTLLRPNKESDQRSNRSFSPSRFGPPALPQFQQQQQQQPQQHQQHQQPLQSVSSFREFFPNSNTSQHGGGSPPPIGDFSQPKRVNLGFSLHGNVLPSIQQYGESSVFDHSMNLSSPPNSTSSFLNFDLNNAQRQSSTTIIPASIVSESPFQSNTTNGLQRSPSRFAPVQLLLQQPSKDQQQLQPNSSTPSKRSLDTVELVSSDDDVPLAKRV